MIKYLAYGSNLNMDQMAYRCPDAKPLGNAYIPGWKLVFRGVADIVPSKGSKLAVGLWDISERDQDSLDVYEGYPSLYRRIDVFGFMTYQMNRYKISEPSKHYYDIIKEGYLDFDLEVSFLEKARDESTDVKRALQWMKG